MKTTATSDASVSKKIAHVTGRNNGKAGGRHILNAVLVYEDAATRQWAREVFERVKREAGHENARATWWKIGDLNEPAVLAGAASMAMRADVVVLAIRRREGMPLPFYVWVNSWLPHRLQRTGPLP